MKQQGKGIVVSTLCSVIAVTGIALMSSGCADLTGYSVASFQGPLPMHDYQWLEQGAPYHRPAAPGATASTVAK